MNPERNDAKSSITTFPEGLVWLTAARLWYSKRDSPEVQQTSYYHYKKRLYRWLWWLRSEESSRLVPFSSIHFPFALGVLYNQRHIDGLGTKWHLLLMMLAVCLTPRLSDWQPFGMLIADWFGGLSLGWWERNHNVPIWSPTILFMTQIYNIFHFLQLARDFFNNVYSTFTTKSCGLMQWQRRWCPCKNFSTIPFSRFGRFNLYRLSWTHLLLGQGPRHGPAAWFRYFELAGLSFFSSGSLF